MVTVSPGFLPLLSSIHQKLNRSYLLATILVLLSGAYLLLAGSTIEMTTVQQVPVGSAVISYLDDPHIINHLASTQPFAFDFQQAPQSQDKIELSGELSEADFVVVRALNDNGLFAPVADPAFIQQFGTEPVHQIFRGRGVYRMPVIQIYQRISDGSVQK